MYHELGVDRRGEGMRVGGRGQNIDVMEVSCKPFGFLNFFFSFNFNYRFVGRFEKSYVSDQ